MYRHIIRTFSIFLVFSLGIVTNSWGFGSEYFAVYEKEVGGVTTLYVVPKEMILIIHSDIAIPITYIPDTQGISVEINGNGSFENSQSIDLNSNDLETAGGYTLTSYSLSMLDFNNDGLMDFMLEGVAEHSSVVVNGNSSSSSILWQRVAVGPIPPPINPGGTTRYNYDALGRLRAVEDNGEVKESIQYDRAGNRCQVATVDIAEEGYCDE